MIGTASALDDDTPSKPVSMPCLLLYSLEVARDLTTTPEGRRNAVRTADALLAVAVAHGFRRAPRLRELCADGFYSTPEASRLARLALDHVPADRLRAALDRAGLDTR